MKFAFICLVFVAFVVYESEGWGKPYEKRIHRYHFGRNISKPFTGRSVPQLNKHPHRIRYFQVPPGRRCNAHKGKVEPKIETSSQVKKKDCFHKISRKQHPWIKGNVRHNYYHFGRRQSPQIQKVNVVNNRKAFPWIQRNRQPFRFGQRPHHKIPFLPNNGNITITQLVEVATEVSSTTTKLETATSTTSTSKEVISTESSIATAPKTTERTKIDQGSLDVKVVPTEKVDTVVKEEDVTEKLLPTSTSEPFRENTTNNEIIIIIKETNTYQNFTEDDTSTDHSRPSTSEEDDILEVEVPTVIDQPDSDDQDAEDLLKGSIDQSHKGEVDKEIDDPIIKIIRQKIRYWK